jgi:D-glycero-D-manno-heptose 1,7-bisphosphate phosphatase
MIRGSGAVRRAVFLGRDGVLNEDRPRGVARPEDFAWIAGAIPALRALRRGGWRLVVATNQPAIARGLLGPAAYDNLTSWMRAELRRQGVSLDGVYHCPHLPDAPLVAWRRQCACRKPRPGMLQRAARDLQLDLRDCVVIGDSADDIAAGRAAGVAAAIRIAGATGAAAVAAADPAADYTCDDLAQAADWLLHHEKRQRA